MRIKTNRLQLLLLLLLSSMYCSAFPVDIGSKGGDLDKPEKHVEMFYSPEEELSSQSKSRDFNSVIEKLKKMQKFRGLDMTGKVDAETLDVMNGPRCGVPDLGDFTLFKGNPKWDNTKVTYRFLNYTPDLPEHEVRTSIQKAFQVWSDVSPLTFEEQPEGTADIMISFVKGDHGDNSPFNYSTPVLAHAFSPGKGKGGDAHFNEYKQWTVEGTTGYNLFLVAAHEFGHSLGLNHSSDIGSLMFRSYVYQDPRSFQLSQDDIDGIQTLYGKLHNSRQPTGPVTPEACSSRTTFDAVTNIRGEIRFFKDRFFWHKPLHKPVELNVISKVPQSLLFGIDAAYESYGKVFLFKGNQYWVLYGYGYPKSITQLGFPRYVNQIDAAFSDPNTRKTYFFVGGKYWRYDEYRQSMGRGYPRNVAQDFRGVGPKIDAALWHDGYVYFFQGTKQIQFDLNSKRIVRDNQRANSWLNC